MADDFKQIMLRILTQITASQWFLLSQNLEACPVCCEPWARHGLEGPGLPLGHSDLSQCLGRPVVLAQVHQRQLSGK